MTMPLSRRARARTGLRLFSAMALGLVALQACTANRDEPESVLSLRMNDGRALSSSLPAADTVVLLLHDPSDCLACGLPIGVWREWERRQQRRSLMLVLTHPASPAEELALATARVVPAGVLSEERRPPFALPAVFYLVHGRTRDSGFTRPGVHAMMDRVAVE